MNDLDHHAAMTSYALLFDIENWLDLCREKTSRKLLAKDIPDICNAVEKLLIQANAMLDEIERTSQ